MSVIGVKGIEICKTKHKITIDGKKCLEAISEILQRYLLYNQNQMGCYIPDEYDKFASQLYDRLKERSIHD